MGLWIWMDLRKVKDELHIKRSCNFGDSNSYSICSRWPPASPTPALPETKGVPSGRRQCGHIPSTRSDVWCPYGIGSMYDIYANIWGILMGSMLPYIAYMDPMGIGVESLKLAEDLSDKKFSTTGTGQHRLWQEGFIPISQHFVIHKWNVNT